MADPKRDSFSQCASETAEVCETICSSGYFCHKHSLLSLDYITSWRYLCLSSLMSAYQPHTTPWGLVLATRWFIMKRNQLMRDTSEAKRESLLSQPQCSRAPWHEIAGKKLRTFHTYQVTGVPHTSSALWPTVSVLYFITYELLPWQFSPASASHLASL